MADQTREDYKVKMKENLKMTLKSLVIPYKHGCTIRQLMNDYKDIEDSIMPYRELGYGTIMDFLRSMPDAVRVGHNKSLEVALFPVNDESTEHIQKLVSGQKNKSKPKSKRGQKIKYGQRSNRLAGHYTAIRQHQPRYNWSQSHSNYLRPQQATSSYNLRSQATSSYNLRSQAASSSNNISSSSKVVPADVRRNIGSGGVPVDVRRNIEKLLLDYKTHGMHLNNFEPFYKRNFREEIKYTNYGFSSLLDLFRSLPNVCSLKSEGETFIVFYNDTLNGITSSSSSIQSPKLNSVSSSTATKSATSTPIIACNKDPQISTKINNNNYEECSLQICDSNTESVMNQTKDSNTLLVPLSNELNIGKLNIEDAVEPNDEFHASSDNEMYMSESKEETLLKRLKDSLKNKKITEISPSDECVSNGASFKKTDNSTRNIWNSPKERIQKNINTTESIELDLQSNGYDIRNVDYIPLVTTDYNSDSNHENGNGSLDAAYSHEVSFSNGRDKTKDRNVIYGERLVTQECRSLKNNSIATNPKMTISVRIKNERALRKPSQNGLLDSKTIKGSSIAQLKEYFKKMQLTDQISNEEATSSTLSLKNPVTPPKTIGEKSKLKKSIDSLDHIEPKTEITSPVAKLRQFIKTNDNYTPLRKPKTLPNDPLYKVNF